MIVTRRLQEVLAALALLVAVAIASPTPVSAAPRCTPGPNEVLDDDRRCVCQPGFQRNTRGRCIKGTSARDRCINRGRRWTGSRCLAVPAPSSGSNPDLNSNRSNRIENCELSGGSWNGLNCSRLPSQQACGPNQSGVYPNCRLDLPRPLKIPQSCPYGFLGSPPNCYEIYKRNQPNSQNPSIQRPGIGGSGPVTPPMTTTRPR